MHSTDAPALTIVKDEAFDRALEEAPNTAAVFLIWPSE